MHERAIKIAERKCDEVSREKIYRIMAMQIMTVEMIRKLFTQFEC